MRVRTLAPEQLWLSLARGRGSRPSWPPRRARLVCTTQAMEVAG